MTYLVSIFITRKKGVLDPEAKTIEKACKNMGYSVKGFKTGKYFFYESDKKSKEEVWEEAKKLSNKLLSNPIIENFEIDSIKEK